MTCTLKNTAANIWRSYQRAYQVRSRLERRTSLQSFERFMDIRDEDTSPSDISREIPGWYVYRRWSIRRQKTYWWTARSAIDLTITYITLWLKTSIDIYPRSHCTYCVCITVCARVWMYVYRVYSCVYSCVYCIYRKKASRGSGN